MALQLVAEMVRLLGVQSSITGSIIGPIAHYLNSLWVDTSSTDPSKSTLLEVGYCCLCYFVLCMCVCV